MDYIICNLKKKKKQAQIYNLKNNGFILVIGLKRVNLLDSNIFLKRYTLTWRFDNIICISLHVLFHNNFIISLISNIKNKNI